MATNPPSEIVKIIEQERDRLGAAVVRLNDIPEREARWTLAGVPAVISTIPARRGCAQSAEVDLASPEVLNRKAGTHGYP